MSKLPSRCRILRAEERRGGECLVEILVWLGWRSWLSTRWLVAASMVGSLGRCWGWVF